MKFEYKSNNSNESNIEHYRYITYKSLLDRVKIKCTNIPALVSISLLIYSLSSKSSLPFNYVSKLVLIAIVAVIGCFALINYKRKNSKKVRKSPFIDAESIFEITIDDNSLTRKSEFSFIKLPLSKISSIDFLKHELVINFGNLDIFIPKDSLPVTAEEFIKVLKDKNSDIIVNHYSEKIKGRRVGSVIVIILAMLLSLAMGYFSM